MSGPRSARKSHSASREMPVNNVRDYARRRVGDDMTKSEAASETTAQSPYWPHIVEPEVRYDIDAEFHALYDAALAATQMQDRAMRRLRYYLFAQALRRLKHIPGDAAEIGCFRGLSAYIACSILAENGAPPPFHIFDSFEGLSESVEGDESEYLDRLVKQIPVADADGRMFSCPESRVQANLQEFKFIQYYKGWVPNRFSEVADRKFRYVHVDTDLYEPTKESVKFFWPRISPGGIMVLDDFGTVFFPGARKAVEEVLGDSRDAMIVEAPAGSAVVVKLGV